MTTAPKTKVKPEQDFKSILNNLCQGTWKDTPKYSRESLQLDGKSLVQVTVTLPNGRTFKSRPNDSSKNGEWEVARIACNAIQNNNANINVAVDAASSSSRKVSVGEVSPPVAVSSGVSPAGSELPPNHNYLVLVKMLDIFRQALLQPLRRALVSKFGEKGWLGRLKSKESSLREGVRGCIDEKMFTWDVACVCAVAKLLLKDERGFTRPLEKIADAGRNRVAHLNQRSELAFRDWSKCKSLILHAIDVLQLWNSAFPNNQVDRHFIQELRDVAKAASASLIEAPSISHNDLQFGDELATGGAATVLGAVFRGDRVAVKRFSPERSETLDRAVRKELQTMVSSGSRMQ